MNGIKRSAVCRTIKLPRSRKMVMTVSDKQRKYDCTTCPYPRYKDGILDEQKEKKERKEQPNE